MRFWLRQLWALSKAAWELGFKAPTCRHDQPVLIELVASGCSRCTREHNREQDVKTVLLAWKKYRAYNGLGRPIVSETLSLDPPAGIREGACMGEIYQSFVDGDHYWFVRR